MRVKKVWLLLLALGLCSVLFYRMKAHQSMIESFDMPKELAVKFSRIYWRTSKGKKILVYEDVIHINDGDLRICFPPIR